MPTPITFVVPGVRSRSTTRGGGDAPPPPIGRLKDSVSVAAQRSAGDSEVAVTATPGEDVVIIHIAGGPALCLHPETARDLLLAQQDPSARGGTAIGRAPGEVGVPVRLQWRLEDASPARGAARGFLGDVLIRTIQIVGGFAEDQAADFAASVVVKRFDAQVDPGVYQLNPNSLTALKGTNSTPIAASDAPSLVLIHGTFSQTAGTFGKLWISYPQLVRSLFDTYGNRVYALDHPTLGASPVANAITLAEAAPANATLHLLTHSRGGLVAEVLARVCANPVNAHVGFAADANSLKELKQLAAIVAAKHLSVDRVVRVACPARGTLLASKRLDAYISVLRWALELAQIPIVPELVEFLGEVARRRADPDALPGLAAQIPDSPLVNWLHSEGPPIKGSLRVVSGDLQGDSVITWVKTLLSDAYYWTDNDLVVQTRSMYGGTPRNESSIYLLDQGGKVSHFSYFSNPQTATAIVGALTNEAPDGFRVIGPLSWGGTSSTGVRAAVIERSSVQAAALPAVFLLPGILGSNLKAGNDRIWLGLSLVNGFDRLAYDGANGNVTPDGPIAAYYDDLATFLSATHDVKPFAFDWRRPILDEAKRLAREVNAALDARKQSRMPVRILAHSMGGLVARAMQIVSGATWTRMMDNEGARLVMLGTPNHGSWAPMQVLSGDDTFGNLLTAIGAPFHSDDIRQVMADFPGLIELQAGLLDGLDTETAWSDLAKADVDAMRANSVWHRLPLQLAQYAWGVPAQKILDGAVKLRRMLDRQRDVDLPSFAQKLLLVVGTAPLTPAKYKLTKSGVVYLDAMNQGDGRVLLESALLPGVATWVVDADHGALPRRMDAFEGYRDLLATGTTARLKRLAAPKDNRGAASNASALVASRPARTSTSGSPPQRETELLTTHEAGVQIRQPESAAAALRLSVVNGDLTYIPDPLLIGHYRALLLSGAEAVMDKAIGGAMSASLRHGLYPSAPGTHQVFVNSLKAPDNPWQLPRPHAVIVVGLGAEGELRGTELAMSVRQAVIAWVQRLTERAPVPTVCSLATTLLGSGGTGITAGQAAQLIAQGVQEANELLIGDDNTAQQWPRIDHLTMVELYLDRASEAWNALQALVASAAHRFALDPVVERGVGAIERPADAGYRGADYDFISALTSHTDDGGQQIVYTVNTRRARSDVRPQATQVPLIRSLVSSASNSAATDTQIGRTLFSLLVPPDLEPFLGSSTETVLELDEGTAAIPWEVLEPPHHRRDDSAPWSIRTKLLRKLRLSTPDFTPSDAGADDSILVIGDPACDRSRYPVLPGARREAEEVASCLMRAIESSDGDSVMTATVRSVISGPAPDDEPDANAVVNAVMEQPWRVIHIAAHGEPPEEIAKNPDPRGVVLSGERTYLGPREISALRVIPELVFVNCCHLGTSGAQVLGPANYDRARFASGVAHALIKGGVRCVIAAGWAVDDEAASKFAAKFYDSLLDGARFIDAVAAARVDARACGGNTWAAYQCYGDPEWRFRRATGDAQRPSVMAAASPAQEFATIASAPALIAALERIAVKSNFQGADPRKQADRLRYLEAVPAPFWQHRGDVAEAFGTAWQSAGFLEDAIRWYERARNAQDGTASLAAIEQLAHVRIRAAWNRLDKSGRAAGALAAARREIEDALALLDTISGLGSTFDRENFYGSTYKRIALLEAEAGRDAAAAEATELMRQHYAQAEKIARAAAANGDPKAPPLFYAAMDRIGAQLAIGDPRKGIEEMDAATIEAIRSSMASAVPDFWSVVGQTELEMYIAASHNDLANSVEDLLRAFTDHHALVPAPRMWTSVLERAQLALSGYRKHASETEVEAADRLLAHLTTLAGRTSPTKSEMGESGRQKAARKKPRGSAVRRKTRTAKKRKR